MPWSRRALVALAVFAVVFAFCWVGKSPPAALADIDFLYVAARGLVHGLDPYEAVRGSGLPYPLFYPGTAPVLLSPLGLIPLHLAASLFLAGGAGALAWVWSREPWRLLGLASAPLLHAVVVGQWSPWLTAAVGLPWLGLVWAAKPSVGLAYLAGWHSRGALIGMGLLTAVSLVVLPHWPQHWFQSIHDAPYYVAPIKRPFGWVLLLAFLRWREPEGRFLGLMALVPHTVSLQEALPFLLVARSRRELLAMLGLGWACWALMMWRVPLTPQNVPPMLAAQWPYLLALVYLPPVVLLIARRSTSDSPAPHPSLASQSTSHPAPSGSAPVAPSGTAD